MDLDSIIEQAKNAVGAIIQRPKMTEKLLARPPFRFLHDTVTAISVATNFAEGLYSEAELDSAALTEKQQKLDYLDKIINMVGICKGEVLAVKSIKVVQGLEPENTCLFLVALAECATNPNVDSAAAVRRTLAGEVAGQGPPALRSSRGGSGAQAKPDGPPVMESQSKGGFANEDEMKGGFDSKRFPGDSAPSSERGKSRSGTRGGKPALMSDGSVGLTTASSRPANIDAEVERCDGSIELTQELMGSLIQRPKMTEKLLAKPPFRFLHDIITEVNRVTGFATGLYTPEEMDSANVTEKEKKIEYLQRIIDLVGLHLSTLVEAKPSKIVMGVEAQDTNRFLQLLAVAARSMPDSRASVTAVLERNGLAPAAASKPAAAPAPQSAPMDDTRAEEKPRPVKKPEAQIAKPEDRREIDSKPMDNLQVNPDDIGAGDSESKKSLRPTTARRRPPKVQDGSKEVDAKPAAISTTKATGILVDGQDDDDVLDDTTLGKNAPMPSMSSNATDVKESKILNDILGRQAEQEVAAAKVEGNEGGEENKDAKTGGGIKLGRLRKTGADKKASSSSSGPSPTAAVAPVVSNPGDIDRLRRAVQVLVQHTGPLGTSIDFIQEDATLMSSELHRWEEECRKSEIELDAQKQKTAQILKPLIAELNELEEQIKDKLAKISGTKASISRNEERIRQILKLVATS